MSTRLRRWPGSTGSESLQPVAARLASMLLHREQAAAETSLNRGLLATKHGGHGAVGLAGSLHL